MARRPRISLAEAEQAAPARSIAAFVAREDERLKAAESTMTARLAIDAANPDGPRELLRKPAADDQWRWRDETAVARELAGVDATHVSSFYGQSILGRSASLGAQLDRAREGLGFMPSTVTAYEPAACGSAHLGAALGVWVALTAGERLVLAAMYGDLIAAGDGGPRTVAEKVHEFMRAEAEGSARALFHELGEVGKRWSGLDLQAVTSTQLAAIKLGRLGAEADQATKACITGELSVELRAARRSFRDRLRRVDVNEHLARLQDQEGIPRDRRPFLIPPASLKELEAQRARAERVCTGAVDLEVLDPSQDVLPAIAAGYRPHCGSGLVVADVSSWARCDVCRLPRRRGSLDDDRRRGE